MPWGKVQRLGAVALVALSVGFFAFRCATSSEIPYISQRGDPHWIMPPVPVKQD